MHRPTFEQRLLRALGPTFALGLFLLWLVGLEVSYLLLNLEAHRPLAQEAEVIEHAILRNSTVLHPEFYYWDEPHHRLTEPRVNPFFVVLFDSTGNVLRTSENVQRLSLSRNDILPLLAREQGTFTFRSKRFSYHTYPLRNNRQQLVGILWLAHYEPRWKQQLLGIGVLLGGGLMAFFFLLMMFTRRTARRVLAPLHEITTAAASLDPHDLSRRIPIPEDADHETALLAETLNQQLERLHRAFEDLRSFSHHAAHELQTPLTIFTGHLEYLLRRPRSEAQYRERLTLLLEEARRMQRLIRQLLLLARMERDTHHMPTHSIPLNELAHRVVETCRSEAEARGLALELTSTCQPTVRGYPELLQEAIGNVLDNALKYTAEGGIFVRLYCTEKEAILEVSDTGKGIATQDLPHITEMFYRTQEHPEIPGYGVGLSLVARIVQLHHGNLRIQSTPGNGTLVTMTFPIM